jgi:hypothetical protein
MFFLLIFTANNKNLVNANRSLPLTFIMKLRPEKLTQSFRIFFLLKEGIGIFETYTNITSIDVVSAVFHFIQMYTVIVNYIKKIKHEINIIYIYI